MSLLDDPLGHGMVIKRKAIVGRRDVTSRGRLSDRNFVTLYNQNPPVLVYDAVLVDEIGESTDDVVPMAAIDPMSYNGRVLTPDGQSIDLKKVRCSDWLTVIQPLTLTGLFREGDTQLTLEIGSAFRLLGHSFTTTEKSWRVAILYPSKLERRHVR